MKKIKVGIAGLGTVGKGVYEILHKDSKMLAKRSGAEFEVVAVSARSKKDFVDAKIKFYENAMELAADADVEVVVELIGGISVAKDLVIAAIKNGKKVVTANKALLAQHGLEIAALVEKHGTTIGFEAAVAGANPVIKAVKEGLAANEISEIYAILNGTCNFVLSKMVQEQADFAEVLQEAQKLGYAEADPTLDIKGFDAAHKISLLTAIALSAKPAFDRMEIEGIDEITIADINLARELGYNIKLLGIYKNLGEVHQCSMYPALISKNSKIAQVDGPFNAALLNASNASWNMFIGRGAGGLTTGSAVVADLVDVAMNRTNFLFGAKVDELIDLAVAPLSQRVGEYFLRLKINKNLAKNLSPRGDLAKQIFGEKIDVQKAVFFDLDEEILCGFLTKSCLESDLVAAFEQLDQSLVSSKKFIRVEKIDF